MSDWGKGVINNIGWGQGADNDIGWGSIYDKSNAGETLLKSDLNIDAFIIEVDTTKDGTPSDQFQFTGAEGDYDVVAKQNNIIVQTFSDLSDAATLTFANGAGTYTLEVNAKETDGFTGMRFNDSGDKEKLLLINQWGVFNDTRTALFLGCSNLTQIGDDNNWLNSINNGSVMFRNCGLTSLPNTLTLANLVIGIAMFDTNSLTVLPPNMTLNNVEQGFKMFDNNNITTLPNNMTFNMLINGDTLFNNNNLTDLPDGLTFSNLENGDKILNLNTINTARYSQLLVDMAAGNNNTNVPFSGGNSKYNDAGEVARNLLIANQNWTITDGGLA